MGHIPKKKFIDAAVADGSLAEATRFISASYLMGNLCWSFMDDATEQLKKHGLLLGDISRATGKMNFAFKDYIAVYRDIFRNRGLQMNFAEDFDNMKAAVLKALDMQVKVQQNKNKS